MVHSESKLKLELETASAATGNNIVLMVARYMLEPFMTVVVLTLGALSGPRKYARRVVSFALIATADDKDHVISSKSDSKSFEIL